MVSIAGDPFLDGLHDMVEQARGDEIARLARTSGHTWNAWHKPEISSVTSRDDSRPWLLRVGAPHRTSSMFGWSLPPRTRFLRRTRCTGASHGRIARWRYA